MSNLNLTRVSMLDRFTDFLRDIGAPVERALEDHSLPVQGTLAHDAYVPANKVLQFLAALRRREGVDDLVFSVMRDGTELDLNNISVAPPANGGTLLGALRRFFRYGQLIAPDVNVSCRRVGRQAIVEIEIAPELRAISEEFYDWTLILQIVSIIQDHAGQAWTPQLIVLRPDFQPCQDAHGLFENSRIVTGQPVTLIAFPYEFLAYRRCDERGGLYKVSGPGPICSSDACAGFADRLRLILRSYLGDGRPRIEQVAEVTGMSARSLQRRLRVEGVSFRELVELSRCDIAFDLLANTDLKVIDISHSCGFQDPAHFARAFKRSTGLSPREYRACF